MCSTPGNGAGNRLQARRGVSTILDPGQMRALAEASERVAERSARRQQRLEIRKAAGTRTRKQALPSWHGALDRLLYWLQRPAGEVFRAWFRQTGA